MKHGYSTCINFIHISFISVFQGYNEVYYNEALTNSEQLRPNYFIQKNLQKKKGDSQSSRALRESPIVKNIVRDVGHRQLLHSGQFMGCHNGRERFVKSIQVYVQKYLQSESYDVMVNAMKFILKWCIVSKSILLLGKDFLASWRSMIRKSLYSRLIH